ncbi:MAG: hypothetical protein JNK85_17260 [Verrucomicrobiales bacterium]|nr:hypothetical protein [Verrucomicrobiales bacterium]
MTERISNPARRPTPERSRTRFAILISRKTLAWQFAVTVLLACLLTPHPAQARSTYAKTISGILADGVEDEAAAQLAEADVDGSVVVAGNFLGGAQFGPTIRLPVPSIPANNRYTNEVFLGRIDGNGGWVWAKRVLFPLPANSFNSMGPKTTPQDSEPVRIKDLKVTPSGIFLAGSFRSAQLNSVGFVLKTDTNGNVQWTRFVVAPLFAEINAVAETSDGGICIGGSFLGSAALVTSVTPSTATLVSLGNSSIANDYVAFVAKMTANATGVFWKLACGSGNSTREETVALSVDGNSDIHVLMNLAANGALYNADNSLYVGNVSGDFTTTPVAGRLGSDGRWKAFNALGRGADLGGLPAPSSSATSPTTGYVVNGTDLRLIGGKTFVAGLATTTTGGATPGTTRVGFLTRLGSDDYTSDNAVVYFRSGALDASGYASADPSPLRIKGSDGLVLAAGQMPTTLHLFSSDNSRASLGPKTAEIVGLQPSQYVGAFDLALNTKWLKTTAQPSTVRRPSGFTATALAYLPTSDRIVWGGGFRANANEVLLLGESPDETSLQTMDADQVRTWGWLTALHSNGIFVRQATLQVISAHAPILVNSVPFQTTNYVENYLEGTTIRLAVQNQISSGTRHLVEGYSIDTQVGDSQGRTATLLLFDDATVTFKWRTDHKLTILSDHEGVGLTEVAAAGDPSPPQGMHWITAGETVSPTVGGYVVPVNSSDWGRRYVVKDYQLTAAGPTQTIPVPDVVDRVQVSQLTMTNPVTITYRWKKQHRLNVQTPSPEAAPLLLTRQTSTPTNSAAGTGYFWFDDNAAVQVLARATSPDGLLSLKGWSFAGPVPVFFPSTTFEANDLLIPDATELATNNTLVSTVLNNVSYWSRSIPTFTNEATIIWSYGETIFPTNIAVGASFSPPALPNLPTPPKTRWNQLRVLDAPPGSTPDDMMLWDAKNQFSIVTRPGIFLVDWDYGAGPDAKRVVFQVYSGFAGDPWQNNSSRTYSNPVPAYSHIAATPPVELDASPNDKRFFSRLLYSTGDGIAANGQFSAQTPGKTVLLFYSLPSTDVRSAIGDTTREDAEVRVVQTRRWNDSTPPTSTATIGARLSSSADTANRRSGYVINELANYNPDIYDRNRAQGPIIPVNSRPTVAPNPNTPGELVVVWYEAKDGIEWPSSVVWYNRFIWPSPPTRTPTETSLKRIVIASRLGSEGLDAAGARQVIFDPTRYENVKVYNQPDRLSAGYNPNEEHARVFPSLRANLAGQSIPAAFALRHDLNITTGLIAASGGQLRTSQFTSDPYVLVQYFDKEANEAKMAVYQVVAQDPATRDPWALALPGSVSDRYEFLYRLTAGEFISAPYPLNQLIGATPCINTVPGLEFNTTAAPNGTYFQYRGLATRSWFVDHKGGTWAVAGGTRFAARFFYTLPDDFWYPFDLDDVGNSVEGPGDCLPFLPSFNIGAGLLGVFDFDDITRTEPVAVQFDTVWPADAPILKAGETLTYAGGEYKSDNPETTGLPGVVGFAAGEVVFDSLNPSMQGLASSPTNFLNSFSARVIAPLEERTLPLPIGSLPANLNSPASPDITVDGDTWYFNKLPPSLQRRLLYRPLAKLTATSSPGVLVLRGFLNDRTLGDSDLTASPPPVYVLEPNVLTTNEVGVLKAIAQGSSPNPWTTAIDALYALSRNPLGLAKGSGNGWNVGLEPIGGNTNVVKPLTALGPGLAVVTNPRLLDPTISQPSSAYITIAENNHPSLGAAPVALHVLRIAPTQPYRGAIKTILPANVFDEKITLRHTADFGGNVDQIAYAWWYHEDDGTVKVGDLPTNASGWNVFGSGGDGVAGWNQIDLHSNPALLLADNLFLTHYRFNVPLASNPNWSAWAGAANSSDADLDNDGRPDYRAQLASGWVKRVLDAVNPYEARIRDFAKNTSPSTAATMIQQLGGPFVGPVALNASKDVVENLGLIELYETVLRRARLLSIDASQPLATPGINAAILLASTRLAEFYTLLGHEAWDDALDPTIGYGMDGVAPNTLNSARYCFENQVPSLLAEELALLRGVDENHSRPVFNRLVWNFTKGAGEVAYALNYQITDANNDGFVDELDALKQHPMGHGDAWGHYLQAMRKRYDLLVSPFFDWEARGEYYNLLDIVVSVDYSDERSFARTAAARAQVGAEIVQLTFRSRYSESPDAKLTGYTDPDSSRAWGVTEWARRTSQAALCDWLTANALLPAVDPNPAHQGSDRLDRYGVPEIAQIATHLAGIQVTLDAANSGLNALGLDPDVLPFDIDPTHIDVGSTAQIGTKAVQGLSHYEQIFERALEALRNASVAFDHANHQKSELRKVALNAEQLRLQAVAQDLEYRNRLIEIFGTPYDGQIGPGKAYPAGYAGPDLNLFMYVDVNAITAETVPVANNVTYFDEYVSFYDLANFVPEEFQTTVEEHFLNDISLEGNTAVELLGDDLVHLRLPATAGDYTFVAPADWGQRAAPGRLQTLVGEMLQVQADLNIAVGDYDFLIKQIRDRVELLTAKTAFDADELQLRKADFAATTSLKSIIAGLRVAQTVAEQFAEEAKFTAISLGEALPKAVGAATDPSFVPRGVSYILGNTAAKVANGIAAAAEVTSLATEISLETTREAHELHFITDGMNLEVIAMTHEIEEMLVNEGVTRIRLFSIREQLRGLLDQYRATLQTGVRILEERRNAGAQLAAATQNQRYHDMLFRTGRHEAIQRFRALFDLAQRYCYITAKAYDYETNFDPRDRASAQPLFAEIVRTRSLGRLDENLLVAGPGLAGIMSRLQDNFRAVEGRLGFNNFQLDTTGFSLRNEKARVTAIEGWRDYLAAAKVDDLWSLPEFRRFCRPFAPSGKVQPGIVIDFPTAVVAGKNFFGNDLGPGDSAYDPTLYATKIRAAGIRFENYPIANLARTPYVYLVPAGLDIMTIPHSPTLATRHWKVMDQAIPAPHITSTADLELPGWLATLDSLGGAFGEQRRFSSFRAAVDVSDDDLNVTRFIGRSVWNDRWLLIIPGQSLHTNPDIGIADFIDKVTDIRLTFETYGYSGN